MYFIKSDFQKIRKTEKLSLTKPSFIMHISEKTIGLVNKVPMEDIIAHFVNLKELRSSYRGLCPFHEENTPSFYVDPKKGYKCFGCDAKGSSAIKFIMDLKKIKYPEALILIAQLANITLENENSPVNEVLQNKKIATQKQTALKEISFIPRQIFNYSLKNNRQNCFLTYLEKLFDFSLITELKNKYCIGCTNYVFKTNEFPEYKSAKGSTIFWQIDINGRIRTGKIILYNPETGKRLKEPFPHIQWAHLPLKRKGYELEQCFFGEHLLTSDLNTPIALVESEKTAIIASAYFPEMIWIATGSLTNLNEAKFKVLTGRNVLLIPDKDGFDKWNAIKQDLIKITNVKILSLLENVEIESKSDIADCLIKINYNDYKLLYLNKKAQNYVMDDFEKYIDHIEKILSKYIKS